jgi:uncharacterized membrane protein
MRVNLRAKWVSPAVAVILGVTFLVAAWIAGRPLAGLGSLAIMIAVAALFVFGGRSETIAQMREPDERWRSIDLRATAIAGLAMTLTIIGGTLWQIAHDRDVGAFVVVAVAGSIAYVGALVWLRSRG